MPRSQPAGPARGTVLVARSRLRRSSRTVSSTRSGCRRHPLSLVAGADSGRRERVPHRCAQVSHRARTVIGGRSPTCAPAADPRSGGATGPFDGGRAEPPEVHALVAQHPDPETAALVENAEQQVLRADPRVAERDRLAEPALQRLLGPGGERDVSAASPPTTAGSVGERRPARRPRRSPRPCAARRRGRSRCSGARRHRGGRWSRRRQGTRRSQRRRLSAVTPASRSTAPATPSSWASARTTCSVPTWWSPASAASSWARITVPRAEAVKRSNMVSPSRG